MIGIIYNLFIITMPKGAGSMKTLRIFKRVLKNLFLIKAVTSETGHEEIFNISWKHKTTILRLYHLPFHINMFIAKTLI